MKVVFTENLLILQAPDSEPINKGQESSGNIVIYWKHLSSY